ncbi:MAG: hypothetical protein M2R45_01488 [Verrucomicrobia subdivision 3 bacterium]|nr:hypothetical protein [Limisphaerales bacterium]MCS1413382.1 hypothetical protein [Limisphaerales bacterium]
MIGKQRRWLENCLRCEQFGGMLPPAKALAMNRILRFALAVCRVLLFTANLLRGEAPFQLRSQQITFGLQDHFFGYIGHVQNIPWNGDE